MVDYIQLGQLPNGGALAPSTDQQVVVRGGATALLATPGTASAKTASDNTKSKLASVPSSVTAGNVAVFADTAGTLQDGGTPSGLTPIAARTFLANPTALSAIPEAASPGTNIAFKGTKVISTFNFIDYDYANATGGGDVTASLQNFGVTCYLEAITFGVLALSDQGARVCVKAQCYGSGPLWISSPYVNLPFVDYDFTSMLVRNYSGGGAVTSFYNGDTASLANSNVYQPVFYHGLWSHVSNLTYECNPDNAHLGNGYYGVRTWQMQGNPAVGNGGSGYTVGDPVNDINPQHYPFAPSQCTVASVGSGGAVTAVTRVSGGEWPAPPKILRKMWAGDSSPGANASAQTWADLLTSSPPVPGVVAVFDGSHNWRTTGGTGTGLTLNVDDTTGWVPDFSGGGHTQDFRGLQGDTQIGKVTGLGVAKTTSGTYGPMRAFFLGGENIYINDNVSTVGGYFGNIVYAIDVFGGNRMYNVGAAKCQFVKNSAGNFHGRITSDTPSGPNGYYADISNCENCTYDIDCFNNLSEALSGISYSVQVGGSTVAANWVANCDINIRLQNAGYTGGITAVFVDWCSGTNINVEALNLNSDNTPATYPNSALITFGSNNGHGNTITGTCYGMTRSAMFTNAIPAGFGIFIWNGTENSWVGQDVEGNYSVATPANGTTTLIKSRRKPFVIGGLYGLATASGSITVSIQINGTPVTGLSGITVTSTPQTVLATAANLVSAGDKVTMVLASNASAAALEFTMGGMS